MGRVLDFDLRFATERFARHEGSPYPDPLKYGIGGGGGIFWDSICGTIFPFMGKTGEMELGTPHPTSRFGGSRTSGRQIARPPCDKSSRARV